MNGLLFGAAVLIVTTAQAPAPPAAGRAGLAHIDLELPESRPDPRGDSLFASFPQRTEHRFVRSARATSAKGSKVDRIIAIAAGVSIGWVVGGGIGYAVTPKRGPHDDTSGLKGMMIGAPIGATAGALIGWRLTK